MTDDQEHESFDTGGFNEESGLEDFETGTGGEAGWKSNPLVKIGIGLGVLAVLVGAFTLFGGSPNPVAPSSVPGATAQHLKTTPGGKVSKVYEKALKEVNEKNLDEAIRTGGSTIPLPIGPAKGKIETDANKDSTEDPLERWRRIQEERLKKEQQAKPNPPAPQAPKKPTDPYASDKQALSASMQTQMTSVLEAQAVKEMKTVKVTEDGWLEEQRKKKEQDAKDAKDAQAAQNSKPGDVQVLLPAGRIEYAQLITKADSDVPGPVLAQLASGPLSGDRMIGSFSKQNDYLVLNFDTVVHDGVALQTTAVALDPKTASPGVATDVDHRYFERIILPAAASFIQGIGEAISTSGTTTVSAGEGTTTSSSSDLNTKQELFKGIDKGAEKAGEIIDQDGQQAQVRVVVAAGTQVGVLFTQPVTTAPQTSTTAPATQPTASAPQQIMLQLTPTSPQAQIQQAVQGQTAAQPGTLPPPKPLPPLPVQK